MTSISTTEGWIPAVLMVLYSVIYALMTILLKLAAHDGMDLRVAATYRFVFGAVPNASLLSSSRGLTVCRTWAFNDGQWHVLQKSSSVYDEQVFQALDLVVSEARKFKIRLILPLVNNWDAYGCKKQYVQWGKDAGLTNLTSDDDFFSHPTSEPIIRLMLRYHTIYFSVHFFYFLFFGFQKYGLHIRKVQSAGSSSSGERKITGHRLKMTKSSKSMAMAPSSGSPEGPLHSGGSAKEASLTIGESVGEEEDSKSESISWKGHFLKPC